MSYSTFAHIHLSGELHRKLYTYVYQQKLMILGIEFSWRNYFVGQ